MSLRKGQRQIPTIMYDSPALDAFSRLRVSEPVTLFDSTQQYDLGRIYWEEDLDGAATSTHNPNESSVTLTVTADAGDNAVRQTREYFRYQPGKSLLITDTAVFGTAVSGVNKSWGYYDADNGVYFEQTATGVYQVVLRSKKTGSVVNDTKVQTSWNLDKMDGDNDDENPSGLTLDGTKGQILVIDLQWLSLGRVRVGFEIAGIPVYVHQFLHSNIDSGPYMTTANLPCRYEIGTDGTNGGTIETICTTVISEGGFEEGRGNTFCKSNGITTIAVTTRRPILSIRPKDTFNSIANRGLIVPQEFNSFTEDKSAYFELVYGGTLTNASFASVNDDSIVEFDIAATAITGGIPIAAFLTDKKGFEAIASDHRYPMFLNIAGAHPTSPYTDSLSVVATSRTTSTDCSAAVIWKEIR